jgi:hypothetical protein
MLAKYLLPLMKPVQESSFTFITGVACDALLVPDASMITGIALRSSVQSALNTAYSNTLSVSFRCTQPVAVVCWA